MSQGLLLCWLFYCWPSFFQSKKNIWTLAASLKGVLFPFSRIVLPRELCDGWNFLILCKIAASGHMWLLSSTWLEMCERNWKFEWKFKRKQSHAVLDTAILECHWEGPVLQGSPKCQLPRVRVGCYSSVAWLHQWVPLLYPGQFLRLRGTAPLLFLSWAVRFTRLTYKTPSAAESMVFLPDLEIELRPSFLWQWHKSMLSVCSIWTQTTLNCQLNLP